MKKLLCTAVLAGVIACHSTPASTRTTMDTSPGAATPSAAVQKFLDAVRAGDLQTMAVAWGTKDGPIRDLYDRDQVEKRTAVLQCYLNHDSYSVLGESTSSTGGRTFQLELKRGRLHRKTTVDAVKGPSAQWYVEKVDLSQLSDFCASAPKNP